jgi:pimeloyl-ACP methyl ester carboxylesterase
MMDEIVAIREGEGPELLLVHGGASPARTWSGLAPLKSRWTLATVHRRGFPPSPPPPDGRQDFDVDAIDLAPLLDRRPHVVAHSYGALGALIAATRRPAQVRSLTLIEPPLFYLVSGDPELRRFQRMGDEALAHGLDTEPATLREFLRVAGSPVPDTGPLPESVVQAVRRAHGTRSPSEACPRLDVLREAGIQYWSPLASTPLSWSARPMRSLPSCTRSDWSPLAPGTSSPRRRVSASASSDSWSRSAERRQWPCHSRSATSAEPSRWTPMPASSLSPRSYRPETASGASTTRKSRSLAS